MMDGFGMGGWFGMGLWWIVIIVLLVAAFAFRRGGDGQAAAPASAREALDKRYARGEVGRDEYEQKKRELTT